MSVIRLWEDYVSAIKVMYECTRNVLRSATVAATAGVRHGAPSSCLLFTVYVDQLVRMLQRNIDVDGYLGKLHSLLLMDDTVILAASSERRLNKLNAVIDYCEEYGMVIHVKKTLGRG